VEIDRASDRPVYKQVADALRESIRNGQLRAGEPLPSETQLTARYGVSRNSVRTAMGLLRVEGLVTTQHGRGSFVRQRRPLQRLGPSSNAKRLQTQDEKPDQQLLRAEVVHPPQEVADRLGLRPAERALLRRSLLLLGGAATQLADRYFPLDVTETWQPERWLEEVTLRMPSPGEARQLGISGGVPLVRVLRTLYDDTGRALEASDLLLAGDRHVLVYEIPAH